MRVVIAQPTPFPALYQLSRIASVDKFVMPLIAGYACWKKNRKARRQWSICR